jgi:hypothetical protein
MTAAARWIDDHARHHDRFFLFVDEFDPHEPFDTPEPWASRYDDEWDVGRDGPHLVWPPYATNVIAQGYLSERQAAQTRAMYGSKLSMIDHWFGSVLDAIDRQALWDDTAIIVCTDHGLFLGERDIWGKPSLPFFEPFGHTPLLVAWPGAAPGACAALTTNVDIHATVRDIFDAPSHAYRLHGHSIAPLLDGSTMAIRDYALMGIWGCEVQLTDGRRKYVRAPNGENRPLSMWSNRWSSITPYNSEVARLPNPDRRAVLDYMPATDCPVIRQPYDVNDRTSMFAAARQNRDTLLFDIVDDPDEQENRAGEPLEREMADMLRTALLEVDAPEDQLKRLAL